MDEDGCLYTEEIYQSNAEYVLENAGKTLFQELLADVEREAQAIYNAKRLHWVVLNQCAAKITKIAIATEQILLPEHMTQVMRNWIAA